MLPKTHLFVGGRGRLWSYATGYLVPIECFENTVAGVIIAVIKPSHCTVSS